MFDAENELNKLNKQSLKDICIDVLNNCKKCNYTNEYIKSLSDNINKVEDIDLSYLEKILGRKMSNNDIADFFAYKYYIQKEVPDTEIIKILMINERSDEVIDRTNFSYIWNKRKAELSYLKHNLRFIDAIELLETTKVERFAKSDARIMNFAITRRNMFVVITVELEDGRLKRIISFRPSTIEELKNAEENYEQL